MIRFALGVILILPLMPVTAMAGSKKGKLSSDSRSSKCESSVRGDQARDEYFRGWVDRYYRLDDLLFRLKIEGKGASSAANSARFDLYTVRANILNLNPDFKFKFSEYESERLGGSLLYDDPLASVERETKSIEVQEMETAKKTASIKREIKRRPALNQHLRDQLTVDWLEHNLPLRSVTVLAGNSMVAASSAESAMLTDVIRDLVREKYHILYDADSMQAPLIRSEAGEFGLPLSAAPSKRGGFVVANPYLRMNAFSSGNFIIVTPDSIAGWGMILERRANIIVSPGRITPLAKLTTWSRRAKPYLGVDANFSIRTTKDIDKLLAAVLDSTKGYVRKYDDESSGSPPFELSALIDQAADSELESALSFAQSMVDAEEKMDGGKSARGAIPGGSVIFGSSTRPRELINLVYQSAYRLGQLGVPVSTGGSGGLMEVANAAAYDSGTHSTGIRMDGLASERGIARENQTMTISTQDYSARIPLLLRNRQLMVVAPGGSGTLRELATALNVVAAGCNFPIVFLGKYYEGLVNYLKDLPLPKEFLDRIKLVQTVEELDILDDIVNAAARPKRLRTSVQPTPRNSMTSFVPKDRRDFWRDGDDEGETWRD